MTRKSVLQWAYGLLIILAMVFVVGCRGSATVAVHGERRPPKPPPPAYVVPRPPRPHPHAIWVKGVYDWRDGKWVWIEGHWVIR